VAEGNRRVSRASVWHVEPGQVTGRGGVGALLGDQVQRAIGRAEADARERIDDVARIPEYVARAFATAMNGRPGPVVLVLPEDMLAAPVRPHAVTGVVPQALPRVEAVQAWSDPGSLRTLRTMLLASERPLVIAGGGGWTVQAAQALQRAAVVVADEDAHLPHAR
jgi:thiamine pyrophosphate-dependent acetolactate synthase large subunit-like protein